MKSAYELAMERLGKASPTVKLTAEQKKEIAELESRCIAKTAERELLLKDEILKAIDKGDSCNLCPPSLPQVKMVERDDYERVPDFAARH